MTRATISAEIQQDVYMFYTNRTRKKHNTYFEVYDDGGNKYTEALYEVSQHVYEGCADVDVLSVMGVRVSVRGRALHIRVWPLLL